MENMDSFAKTDFESVLKHRGWDKNFYIKLLKEFVARYTSITQDIKKALNSGDFTTAGILTHTLKGVAGNLSINLIFKTAQKLEEEINKENLNNYDDYDDYLNIIQESIDRTAAYVQQLTKDNVPLSVSYSSIEDVGPYLEKLAKLLQKDNLEATDYFDTIKPLITNNRFKEELEKLEDCINDLDFECAMEELSKIADKCDVSLEGRTDE